MRISLTRAVAVAAIASAAVLPLASTASAATTVAKAPTTLSIVESKARIVPGHLDVIGGVLMTGKNRLAKRTIDLYRYAAKTMTWVLAGADRTSKTGKASFLVKPASTSEYLLVFHGSKTLAASRSAMARVVVARLLTTLSITESRATVAAGHAVVIGGVLMTGKNGLAKRTIDLYRYDAKTMTWVPVAASRARKGGKVAFVVTPMATVRYELVFYGSPSLDPSRSGAASVTVTS
jgi:hypothetical protein